MTERQPNTERPTATRGVLDTPAAWANVPPSPPDTVIRASKRPATPEVEHDGRRRLPPPGTVKPNTLLLAASQAVVGIGTQMVPTLGAITVARLFGAAHLVGMAASTLVGS